MGLTPDQIAELKRIALVAFASGPPAEDEFLDTFDPPAVVALFARIEALEAGLKPFAEAAGHLHPAHPENGLTLDGIEVRHWRRAANLLDAARAGGEEDYRGSLRSAPGSTSNRTDGTVVNSREQG